jgi:hypothetical protein
MTVKVNVERRVHVEEKHKVRTAKYEYRIELNAVINTVVCVVY